MNELTVTESSGFFKVRIPQSWPALAQLHLANLPAQILLKINRDHDYPKKSEVPNLVGRLLRYHFLVTLTALQSDANPDPSLRAGITLNSYNDDLYNYLIDEISIALDTRCRQSKILPPTEIVLFAETADYYRTHIADQITLSSWVKNIFDDAAPGEKVLYRSPDYLLMPDFKWNQREQDLYLLVLFLDRGLRSLRDLTAAHIPLLERINREVLQFIQIRFGLEANRIRAFIHYPPSAWQLHIHYQHVASSKITLANIQAGKAHLLDTVIQNLQLMPDYYQRATIPCIVDNRDYKDLLAT
jgi:hypothetical protein